MLLISLLTALSILTGCTSVGRPVQILAIDPLGYFEYRPPNLAMQGIVIGAPHGCTVPGTALMARWISDQTGAGFVAAYGFESKHVSVEQPVVRSYPYQVLPKDRLRRGSVFTELRQILRKMTNDAIDMYVGLRAGRGGTIQGIEVITSGFTFEEIRLINRAYDEIRDRLIGAGAVEKWPLSFAPLEEVNLAGVGLKHHGVLLIAGRGLSLHVPENVLSGANFRVYRQVFLEWLQELRNLIRSKYPHAAQMQVKLMDLGRFDVIPSRRRWAGVVLGAPHGTYDEYTAEIVKRMAFRTGLAAVIARGFTPTEAAGWRINVNRPTEMTFLAPEFEARTSRSREVYDAFRKSVLDAAGGDLRLYVDVHQYGRDVSIQVATVGINAEQARTIKQYYRSIRDRLLKANPGIAPVELLIEPLDRVEIGAWPAKDNGLLSVAKKSLHFELPLQSALRSEKSRALYTTVIGELVKRAIDDLPL